MSRQLPLFKVFMSEDVLQPLNAVLMSGQITQGNQVDLFEQKLQTYLGNPHTLTLNSATAGLTLALRLLKNADPETNWPGFNEETDVVLSPALTCFATNAAILANQCRIQWLDVDLQTANVCLNDLKAKLTQHTKVVYVVHWGGYPVDLAEIRALQDEHESKYGYRFAVIEDCAHAFGATYRGQPLGSLTHGNICVFSLQAIKHLTTGDGGIITLPTQTLYDRCQLLRWYGIDRDKRNYQKKDLRLEADILESGYKFHMNDISATIGLYNLPHIPSLLIKDRANAEYLQTHLTNVPGLTLLEKNPDRESSSWLFSMRVDRKSDFVDKLKANGITASQVHNRNDIHTCVKEFQAHLPQLDLMEKGLICIPVGWWLSKNDLDYMIQVIKEGW